MNIAHEWNPNSRPERAQENAKKSIYLPILVVLFCLFTIGNIQVRIVDDAYIFGRYAYNLAQYGQLVFNIGEKVEGITSFLWTILLFFNERVLHIRFDLYVTWLSLIILIILSLRIWYFCAYLQMPWLGFLCVILLFSQADFLVSSTNGLEGVLYGYLLFELLVSFWNRKPTLSFIIGGLLYLTRPESIAIPIAMLIIYMMMGENKRVILTKFAIFYLGIVVCITVFRITYYGDVIPNSVISKSFPLSYVFKNGLLPAYKYSVDFLRTNIIFGIIFFTAFLYLLSLSVSSFTISRNSILSTTWEKLVSNSDRGTILLGVYVIAFSFLVTLRNGGDWMPAHRLLSQYMPVYVVMITLLVKEKVLDLRILVSLALISSLSYLSSFSELKIGIPEIVTPNGFYVDIVHRLREKALLDKDDKISAEGIGYISYTLHDQRIFDPLGLTDKHIARYGYPALQYGKTDILYVLTQVRPAIMLWHWGGHLRGYENVVEENYIVFCYSNCDNSDADLIVIRKDKVNNYRSAFMDLVEINNLSNILD